MTEARLSRRTGFQRIGLGVVPDAPVPRTRTITQAQLHRHGPQPVAQRCANERRKKTMFTVRTTSEPRPTTPAELPDVVRQLLGYLLDYRRLPAHLQVVCDPIANLAMRVVDDLPNDDPELAAGLRKLVEAQDCFMRSARSQYARNNPDVAYGCDETTVTTTTTTTNGAGGD